MLLERKEPFLEVNNYKHGEVAKVIGFELSQN
jgi:hypothetical protein